MSTRRQHQVTFLSPGTFLNEQTTRDIEAWDTHLAIDMAKSVVERHGAKPYAFFFTTSIVSSSVPDGEGGELEVKPKQVAKSGTHFLGGSVLTYDDLEQRADPKEEILRSNMLCNDVPIVVENCNSYKTTVPFTEQDVVVDERGYIIVRGDDPRWNAPRAAHTQRRKERYG